ncbi:MAG: M42 family peptidase [Chloroflexi bacterium]|jgi:tetrahedral aminopeptidase|nr:M42 family peptidase [Chloroflexota bacterium]MBT3669852.1 M42 family peptidase [Chloroflexota bacterium]MBT4002864.1 M42 family peptidase [Chloroflexota bacterium]MBT4304753.1 M42 family peptidase [Chloroflexota bacterium]MBT4534745.1 M42 family peptidase [Chloroflexota bacterium]
MKIQKNKEWRAPRIRPKNIELLENLSNAVAVSGDERAVRKIVLSKIKDLVDDFQMDALGNILATKKGKGRNLPKVMLAAHMDEVGFMISSDEGKGFYRFEIVGGIDPRQLAGKPVLVGKDRIPGVIGAKAIHLASSRERKNSISVDSLRIDLGPGNSKKIQSGTWAGFATKFSQIGPSLRGKALDDRVGVATIIALLENPPENIDLLVAFTVQEEVGLRGAKVAAYTLAPDMAIALDCTPSLDMPLWDGKENVEYRSKIGQGPAIYIGDGATLADPRLVSLIRNVGDEYKIPYQIRQPGKGGTDAGNIHKQREGIPSISISVPGRYLHTAASIIRLKDWKNTISLLHASLSHINNQTLKGDRRR